MQKFGECGEPNRLGAACRSSDSDGDSVDDGIEDCDMTNLSRGDHILESTDLNGKFDGMNLDETDPLRGQKGGPGRHTT